MSLICSDPDCGISVRRPWEGLREVAAKLRAAADAQVVAAEERAAELRANADDLVAQAEAEEAVDDFPLCPNHERYLSLDVANALHGTKGMKAAVRSSAIRKARLDLERKKPRW